MCEINVPHQLGIKGIVWRLERTRFERKKEQRTGNIHTSFRFETESSNSGGVVVDRYKVQSSQELIGNCQRERRKYVFEPQMHTARGTDENEFLALGNRDYSFDSPNKYR